MEANYLRLRRRSPDKPGPGAASLNEPAFQETARRGSYANFVNDLDKGVTGRKIQMFNDLNQRQTLPEAHKAAATELLTRYKTDPDFKLFADAARQYVHNDKQIIDVARAAIGKDPIHHSMPLSVTGKEVVAIDNVTLLDGSVQWGKDIGGGHPAHPSLAPVTGLAKLVEVLHDAIRGAKPDTDPKSRGMSFRTNKHWSIPERAPGDPQWSLHTEALEARKNYKIFENLQVGDEIDLPLSSFSYDPSVAWNFTAEDLNQDNVVLELQGPHQGISLAPFNVINESEFLTGGVFEVTRKRFVSDKYKPYLYISIIQKGTF
jgi:hypothetical protein